MPVKMSAGLMIYKLVDDKLEVLLVHPGGPFFRNKDTGTWSIPKGEVSEGEDLLATAKREVKEELGIEVSGELVELGEIKQKGGKIVHAWAFEGDYDESQSIKSNTFELEWPPRSGQKQEFPEIDQVAWFPADIAKHKINSAQAEFIDCLAAKLNFNLEQTVTQQTLT